MPSCCIRASACSSCWKRAMTALLIHAGLDQFQRDTALDRLLLLGEEHGPHAALAEFLEDAVGADLGRWHRRGWRLRGCPLRGHSSSIVDPGCGRTAPSKTHLEHLKPIGNLTLRRQTSTVRSALS